MFYKLMFLEVGQGYPQPRRQRRTSSVSPEGSDPDTVRLEEVLTPPVSDYTGSKLMHTASPYMKGISHLVGVFHASVKPQRFWLVSIPHLFPFDSPAEIINYYILIN